MIMRKRLKSFKIFTDGSTLKLAFERYPAMLRTFIPRRQLTFFVPSSGLTEYNKKLLQEGANYENLEYNFDKITNQPLKPVTVSKKDENAFEFTRKNTADVLALEISKCCSKRVLEKAPKSSFYWKDNIQTVRYILQNPSNLLLFERMKKLYSVKAEGTQLEQFTDYERSLIIKRLFIHYSSVLEDFKTLQRNKDKFTEENNLLEKEYQNLKEVASSIRKIFNVFLSSDSYAFTLIDNSKFPNANRENKIRLKIYDFENIVSFFALSQSPKRAIDIISALEAKNYILSNLLWAIKVELLTKSSTKSWNIYGAKIFKGYSGKLHSNYEYKAHVSSVQELLARYQLAINASNLNDSSIQEGINFIKGPDSNVSASFIRAFGKQGDLTAIGKYIKANWGVLITDDYQVTIPKKTQADLNTNNIPDINVITSILLAYTKNGELVTGLQICQSLMSLFSSIFSKADLLRFWHLALRLTGLFGNTVCFHVKQELESLGLSPETKSSFKVQYLLFDNVWKIAEESIGPQNVSKSLISMQMKYASLDSLIDGLPLTYQRSIMNKFNKNLKETHYNKNVFRSYLKHCVYELALRGKYLHASELLERYLGDNCLAGKDSLSQEDIAERDLLKEQLKYEQDKYAMEKVKKTRNSQDDDDDFELW